MKLEREPLSISSMRRHLETEVVGYHVYMFGTVAAAQAAARRLAARGAEDGTVVLAAGAAGLLHVSVLLRPDLAPREVPGFAPIVPLAVVEALEADGVAAEIRWPNDIAVDGRTLARTRVESESVDGRVTHVLAAIDVDLDAAGATVGANPFVARFLNRFEQWRAAFTTQGPEAVLDARRTHGAHRAHLLAAEEVR